MALGIPGVATNTLTGTLTLIVRRLTLRAYGEKLKQEVTIGYLVLLSLGYALSALLVVKSIGSTITSFVPAMMVLVVIIEASIKFHYLKPSDI